MLNYKIPQNVQIEDKITSFLTIRQLIICAVGGGIAYILYISLAPTYYAEIWLPPVAFMTILTIAVAFIRINDIPFTKWFLLLLEFMIRPRARIWDKRSGNELLYSFVTAKKTTAKKEENTDLPQKNLNSLDELSNKIDTNPFEAIDKERKITKSKNRELLHSAIMEEHEKTRHENRLEKSIQDKKEGKTPEKKTPEEINNEASVKTEKEKKVEFVQDKIMSFSKRSSPVREHSHVNTQDKPSVPPEHQELLRNINQES